MPIRRSSIAAVVTGDIVNSTQLTSSQDKELTKKLTRVLGIFFGNNHYEFFRGDSFQVLVKDVTEALRLALACRSVAMSIDVEQYPTVPLFDVRISIGIGETSGMVKDLHLAKGEAFILSGRQFDLLKERGQRLAIDCFEPIANIGFQVIADYLDSIYSDMTAKQADVVVELIQGTTQQQLSAKRKKSKSTISELAAAGRWQEIAKLLYQYETLTKLIL